MQSFRSDASPPGNWREIPPPPGPEPMINAFNSYVRYYRLGECTVIVTRELGRWHLSIAHRLRYPTWDEIATARYNAIPDEVCMGILLPPRSEYVNIHRNCFQLVEAVAAGLEGA